MTDVENLYGQIKFHHAARLAGIKPITGVELRAGFGPHTLGRKAGRLVLLARDRQGYESLCRIITLRRGDHEPPTPDPVQCLEARPSGLFFLSDDLSVVRKLLQAGIAPADLRFLLVRPGGERPPAGVAVVADTDVVMCEPADRDLHKLLVAIRRQQQICRTLDVEPPERSLAPPEALRRWFEDSPRALAETLRVAEACSLDLTASTPVLPAFEGLAGTPAAERLNLICRERLAAGRRAGRWTSLAYEERLARELDTLSRLGLSAYFLIVAEVADRARSAGILVAGRGSAGGSLVAHVLGITPIDPIEHGLYFERFIHPDRADFPDIDLDLPSDRRDELIDWVHRRFGQERVAMVSAHQTFGWRSAFREGWKAFGMSPAELDRFAARLPSDDGDPAVPPRLPLEILTEPYRSAVPLITRLIGKPQHISVHPGGLVIAQPRVVDYAPLERAPKGVLVTQYDMHSLPILGLVKIDLLGNRALTAIQETLRWVDQAETIPDGDAATLRTLRQAETVGCFQIETPTLRSTLRKLPVRGIQDLAAALAIVRPGPASGAAKAAFIRRAQGEQPLVPPHPLVEEALRETYGMMLYEEQLMTAIALLTGWSLEKADGVRTAILSAQDAPEDLEAIRKQFLEASARHGVLPEQAAAIWTKLANFAAYSFNKAHATSYAQIAWQTAYLKTHHPAAFACAVLNSYGGVYPLRTLAADFTRHGVRIMAPHVNRSKARCALEQGAVRVGLSSVKYLTKRNRERILAVRPFRDLGDLLERVSLSERELESLVLSGACDGLAPLAPEAYPVAHEDVLTRLRRDRSPRALLDFGMRAPKGPRGLIYQALVRIRNETQFLGMHLSDHPMRVLRPEAERSACISTADLRAHAGKQIHFAGVVAAARRHVTPTGQLMQFVTLEDEFGLVEGVLSPAVYASLGDPISNPGPFLINARVVEDHGDITLTISHVIPFHERTMPYGRESAVQR